MRSFRIRNFLLTLISLFSTYVMFAHPTGNMITVGDHVLWSYINPINDPDHKACVMIWQKGSEPKVLIQSQYAASDYMLYNNQNNIFIIERKYSQSTTTFQLRILKVTLGKEPVVIWDWFKDEQRIGEGGFFMLSDKQLVFGKYPDIFTLTKGEEPRRYFTFRQPIKRIRAVGDNKILLLSDNSCYLVEQNGTIIKQWTNLIDKSVKNAPLSRNQIFDADYFNGQLLISYWGKRSFVLFDEKGTAKTVLQQTEPMTPHWVAFFNQEKLLFSSKLIFDGSTPKPYLILLKDQNKKELLWGTL